MDYNSTREKLIMPEYGRNIQKMIQHATTIQDRDERNRCARTIINIMGNMFPQLRDTADFKHKLWDHLIIMSDFKLDVDSPFPRPEPEKLYTHPGKMPYYINNIRFRHYGYIVEKFVQKATTIDDSRDRKMFVESIANYMKKSLIALNKDFATDDRLFNDIRVLSNNRLEIEEGTKTNNYQEARPQNNHQQRNNNNRNNNNYNNRNNNNRNNNNKRNNNNNNRNRNY